MQQQQQQPAIDLKNTEQLYREDGGILFKQGFILRKISKFITGTAQDMVMPIPVFYDPETKKIIEQTLPDDLKEELKDSVISE